MLKSGYVQTREGLRAELTGPAHRRVVVAEVVDGPRSPEPGVQGWTRTVRWITPEGTPGTGQVVLPPSARAGSRAEIWIDGAGRPTNPPQSHRKTVVVTAFTVIGTMAESGMILLFCLTGIRELLNRHRGAEWERAWILADQRWRRPRQN